MIKQLIFRAENTKPKLLEVLIIVFTGRWVFYFQKLFKVVLFLCAIFFASSASSIVRVSRQ
jgi:hypothetical protein